MNLRPSYSKEVSLTLSNIEPLITTRQAATLVGLSHRTLESMRIKGDGPEYLQLGRAIRYEICELERWIESNRKAASSEQRYD